MAIIRKWVLKMIIRVQKDKNNPYVVVNKQFVEAIDLSWKAKGILLYLLSLPDEWLIYETELATHSKDNISSLRSGMKELIDCHYIHRKRIRNPNGKFSIYEYIVTETPSLIE